MADETTTTWVYTLEGGPWHGAYLTSERPVALLRLVDAEAREAAYEPDPVPEFDDTRHREKNFVARHIRG